MSKHIISKLLDWECRTANAESDMLMEAVSYIDELEKARDRLTAELANANNLADQMCDRVKQMETELAEARDYIRQLEMGHGNKEGGDE